MIGHADGFDRFGAAADLDVMYTRGSTLFSTTAGIAGGGAVTLNTFSSVRVTSTATWGALSSGGVARCVFWVKPGTWFGSTSRLFNIGTNVVDQNNANAPYIGIGSDGSLHVTKHGEAVTVATSATGLAPVGEYRHIQYEARYAEAAGGGYIKLWVDKVLVIDFTGDTLTGTQPTALAGWKFQSDNNGIQGFDDPVLWDDSDTTGLEFTGAMSELHQIEELTTTADDVIQFDSNLSSLNEDAIDDPVFHDGDTSYNQSTAAGQSDVFALADQAAVPIQTYAIGVVTTAKKSDVGGVILRNRLEFGSSRAEGSLKTLTSTYGRYSDWWGKNPSSLQPWGVTDVNNVFPGYEHQA